MIHIDFDTVHELASAASLIEPLRRAFGSPASSPVRSHYDLPSPDLPRTLLLMPSWQDAGIGVKIVTVFPENGARGLASVNALYVLMSGQTGQPRALIDGRALTQVRTAAVSALAADLLAPANPRRLLMVGTGALSRHLIEAHLAVRPYESVQVWGRDAAKAAAVARDLAAMGCRITVADNLQTAVRSASVVSCATLAQQPLIEGSWLEAAAHLDLVGSFRPDMGEADDACLERAFIAVDTERALEESGDLAEPIARGVVHARDICTLHALLSMSGGVPRGSRTVFKSVGVAHADLAVAEHIVERSGHSR
jgi:ornithine cyclodeaminase/alanine dehydrogenase-like protein (mu-crystallin family)